MWVVYSFFTAIFETAKDVVGKKSTFRTDEYVSAFSLQFFTFLVLLPVILLTGVPVLKPIFWLGVSASAILNPLWSLLYMRALKLSPLSVSVPMLAFNPIFVALLAIIFDKKWPDFVGWLGIVLISSGLYLMRIEQNQKGKTILSPILSLQREKGAQAMLGVAFIWSIGVHFQKLVVNGSSPVFASITGPLVGFFTLYLIAKYKSNMNVSVVFNNIRYLLSVGLFNGLSNLAFMQALNLGYTPYAASIKRSNIVFSSILGKYLFHERLDLIKLLGISMMLMGVLALVL